MDKSVIIKSTLKYILMKTAMLILRILYLILLFFIIQFTIISVIFSLIGAFSVFIGASNIGFVLVILVTNLLFTAGNLTIAVIANPIDKFTFKTHVVFTLIHAFFVAIMIISIPIVLIF